jgi:hypothetical protein
MAFVFAPIIGLCSIVYLHRDAEFAYQEKSLAEWCEQFNAAHYGTATFVQAQRQQDEAAYAIRQIGTNGLPYAVRCLAYREPKIREWAKSLLGLQGKPGMFREMEVHMRGYAVFSVLGKSAEGAVPRLYALAEKPETAQQMTSALACVGIKGLQALGRLVTNKSDTIRMGIVNSFNSVSEWNDANVTEAVKIAVELMDDGSTDIRNRVTFWLVEQAENRDSFLAALLRLLEDPLPSTRAKAAAAVGRLGFRRGDILEALSRLTADSDPYVRNCAKKALLFLRSASSQQEGVDP